MRDGFDLLSRSDISNNLFFGFVSHELQKGLFADDSVCSHLRYSDYSSASSDMAGISSYMANYIRYNLYMAVCRRLFSKDEID